MAHLITAQQPEWDILSCNPDRRSLPSAESGFAFYLTNATDSRIIKMTKYSIAEAAKLVGVNKATVYRWIQRKVVPSPLAEVIAGVQITYWTDAELAKLRDYKKEHYRGKGIDRRTGKKAKPK